MNQGEVSQESISAGGDVAGHSIHKNTTIYNQHTASTRLGGLIEQLRDKINADPDASDFLESLLSWMNPKATELKRDLRTKLNDCNQGHLVADAIEPLTEWSLILRRI